MDSARVTSGAVWIVVANAVAALALLALLWKLRTLVSWTLVSLLLTVAAYPAMEWLMRRGLKRGYAVLVIVLAVVAVIATLLATLIPIVVVQGRELIERTPELLESLKNTAPVEWLNERVRIVDDIQGALRDRGAEAAGPAIAVASKILHTLAALITIIALTTFMLLFGDELLERALAYVTPARAARWRELGEKMKKVVGGYVLGTLLVASIGGVVMGVTLLALGVPYFLALGLLMIVLGLIPFLGSAIGAVVLVGVAFASSGTKAGIVTLVVYLVYQQIENHVLHPVVQRRTIQMNPLLVALTLLAGAIAGGILGTLLALPIAGAIQVILHDTLARRRAPAETEPIGAGTR